MRLILKRKEEITLAVYIISDTHFGHNNIIKYTNRPFKDTDEMDEYIAEQWLETVGEDDIVIHLGDIALKCAHLDEVLENLPGKKYLVMGNHDWCRTKTYYRKRGFIEVYDNLEVEVDGVKVLLTHMPDLEAKVPNIHGHLHNATNFAGTLSKYNILYAPELENYAPVKIQELLKRGGFPVVSDEPVVEIKGEVQKV